MVDITMEQKVKHALSISWHLFLPDMDISSDNGKTLQEEKEKM